MKNLFVLLLSLICFTSYAQDNKNPKHVNWYKPVVTETQELKIEIQDAMSIIEFTKFKLKLSNFTNDYIFFKPQESLFKLSIGEYTPQDKKTILIKPLDKESKVIDMKAGPGKSAHVESYQYQLSGLYRVPLNVPALEMPNFKLPAEMNDFTVGGFKVELVDLKKETGETAAKFRITYFGDGVGIVDPKKIIAKGINHKKLNETTAANDKKSDVMILNRGESDTFTATFHMEGRVVDMQLANMEIMWKDTFKESKLVKLDTTTLDLVVDPAMTAAKNK